MAFLRVPLAGRVELLSTRRAAEHWKPMRSRKKRPPKQTSGALVCGHGEERVVVLRELRLAELLRRQGLEGVQEGAHLAHGLRRGERSGVLEGPARRKDSSGSAKKTLNTSKNSLKHRS